jgi:hypothetical protein
MLTFTDQINLCKEYSQLSDATTVVGFKRDVNAGTARFLAKLSRPVDRANRFTSLVDGQQYYQLPEDAIKVSRVKVFLGSRWIDMKQVSDEGTWTDLNQSNQTGDPTHFFVKGYDEFGLFPEPGSNVTNGIELVYEPKHVLLTADDYTTGTIAVTNGSQAITGTGTVFTNIMANGMYILQITDGTDGNYYRVSTYSSGTGLTIENYYQGITSVAATYRIGQVSRIPEEYQEAPVDYAMYRHYLSKNEMKNALLHKDLWERSLADAENTYGMSTSSQIITANQAIVGSNSFNNITENQIST